MSMSVSIRELRSGAAALLSSLAVAVATHETQAGLLPDGDPVQVNSVASDAYDVECTYSADGTYKVMVWTYTDGEDGDSAGIFARFGDHPAEFQINQTTVGQQANPDVSISDAGSVVFVWGGDDPVEESIFGRVFDPAGQAVTDEFRIEDLAGQHQWAAVDHFPDGNFAVTWVDPHTDITYLRVFDPAGNAITPCLEAGTPGNCLGGHLSIGPNSFGVVAWKNTTLAEFGVSYRLFDSAGNWLTTAQSATENVGDLVYDVTTSSSAGRTFVAWKRKESDDTFTLRCRAIDAAGSPIGPESEIVHLDKDSVTNLSLSHDGDHRGALVWQQRDYDEPSVIYVQSLSNNDPVGLPQLVGPWSDEEFEHPSVAHDNLGGLSIAFSTDENLDVCFIQDFTLSNVASTDEGGQSTGMGHSAGQSLRATPSVFQRSTLLQLTDASILGDGSRADQGSIRGSGAIYDSAGRRVRHFFLGEGGQKDAFRWDGTDDEGRTVPAGAYWARVGRAQNAGSSALRIVLVR